MLTADLGFLLLHLKAHDEMVVSSSSSKNLLAAGAGEGLQSSAGGSIASVCQKLLTRQVLSTCVAKTLGKVLMSKASTVRDKRRKFKQGGQGFHRICQPQEGKLWRFYDLNDALFDSKGLKKSSLGKGTPVAVASF
ncbi:unnamed protein product [Amoebophrya sp. A25]|nr:unnamed protein product [Amoebophrya sp. A25]|eukprot:GSA25T00007118001.1